MWILTLLACGPTPPPPVVVPAQTLSVTLSNLTLREVEATLSCRCDASHDGVKELTQKVSTDMEERVPVPVSAQMEGEVLTLEVGTASLVNPYTGPEHMLHSPVCEADARVLLGSPDYPDLVFGLNRDLLSAPTPGAASLATRAALQGLEAPFEADGGWRTYRGQTAVDVSGPLEGELVEVEGAVKLRVGEVDYVLAYEAPHLRAHLGPLTGDGVLSDDTVYWSRFEVRPYSFLPQGASPARVDRRTDPPQIEVQGQRWATLLLNPEAFPEGIWTGEVAYHPVGKYGDLHMQHGVYAYPLE